MQVLSGDPKLELRTVFPFAAPVPLFGRTECVVPLNKKETPVFL
jgi:hypothetical protein